MNELLLTTVYDRNPISAQAAHGRDLRQLQADGEVGAGALSDITPVVGTVQDITILASEEFGGENVDVKYVTPDGIVIAELDVAHTDASASGIAINAIAKTSAEDGILGLQAYNDDRSALAAIYVRSDGHAWFSYGSTFQDVHRGLAQRYVQIANTAELPLATYTIPANAMGTTGRIHVRGHVLIKNNKGSSGTFNMTFYFGSKSFTFINAAAIANSAVNRIVLWVDVEVVNAGASNAQIITCRFQQSASHAAESPNFQIPAQWWTTAAVDTTADAVFKVTIDLSATDANFFAEASGIYDGPYPPF